MPLNFMKDQVTRLRAPLVIKNGMERRDWENAETAAIGNVQVTAQSTSSDMDGRVTQVTDRRTLRAVFRICLRSCHVVCRSRKEGGACGTPRH